MPGYFVRDVSAGVPSLRRHDAVGFVRLPQASGQPFPRRCRGKRRGLRGRRSRRRAAPSPIHVTPSGLVADLDFVQQTCDFSVSTTADGAVVRVRHQAGACHRATRPSGYWRSQPGRATGRAQHMPCRIAIQAQLSSATQRHVGVSSGSGLLYRQVSTRSPYPAVVRGRFRYYRKRLAPRKTNRLQTARFTSFKTPEPGRVFGTSFVIMHPSSTPAPVAPNLVGRRPLSTAT